MSTRKPRRRQRGCRAALHRLSPLTTKSALPHAEQMRCSLHSGGDRPHSNDAERLNWGLPSFAWLRVIAALGTLAAGAERLGPKDKPSFAPSRWEDGHPAAHEQLNGPP